MKRTADYLIAALVLLGVTAIALPAPACTENRGKHHWIESRLVLLSQNSRTVTPSPLGREERTAQSAYFAASAGRLR